MKRLLSFFLVTLLVVASIPASVLSAIASETSFVSVNAPAKITYTGDSANDSFDVSFDLTLASDVAGVAGYEIILKWDAQLLALADSVSVKSSGIHTVNLDNVSDGYAKIVVANATDAIGNGTLFEATFYPIASKADALISAEVQRMSTASGFVSCNGCETAVALIPLPPVVLNVEEHPTLTDKSTSYEEAWSDSSTQHVVLIGNKNCTKTGMDVELIYSLGKTIMVDSVSLWFYHCADAMIGYPEGKATVFVSTNGKTYSEVGSFDFAKADLAAGKYGTVENTFQFPAAEAFYVKVCFAVGSSTDVLGDSPADGKIFWEFAALTEFSVSRYCEHSYKVVDSLKATCTTAGYQTYACEICNDRYTETIDALGHSASDWIVSIPVTCTSNGSRYRECTACKLLLQTESIQSPGHSAGDWTIISEATCSNEGKRVKFCTVCGSVEAEEVIPQTGVHVPGEPEVTKQPTCTATGIQYIKCVHCGFPIKSERVPAKGHTYDEGTVTVAPTCESKGSMLYTCTECSYSYTEEIEKAEHSPINVSYQEPTCTESGYQKQICSVCETVLIDTVLPAIGHKYEGAITTPATCTQAGVMTYTCFACGDHYNEDIDMLEHNPSDWQITVAPTCTTEGTKEIRCTVCESVLSAETVESLGHTAGDPVVKEATCTENGSETVSCTVCQAVIETQVIEATGHKESDWIVLQEPSCTQSGAKEKTCTACGDILASESIDPLGHQAGDWEISIPATCTSEGENVKKCTACGEVLERQTTAMAEHAYNGTVVTEPSCETEGVKLFACQNCDKSYQEPIAANGHTSGDWVADKAATCTENGVNVKKCLVCEKVLQTATVPARGHIANDWVITEEATTDKDGTKVKTCTVCGETLESVTIPKHVLIAPDPDGKPNDINDPWGSGSATEDNITLITNPSDQFGMDVTLVQTFEELCKIESLSISLYHCAESGIGYPEGHAVVLASTDGIHYAPVGSFELSDAKLAIGTAGTVVSTFTFDTAIEAVSLKVLLQVGESTDIVGPTPDGKKTYWEHIGVVSMNAVHASDVPEWVKGDVDGDGAFNTVDYMKLKRYILGTYELDENALLRSDINLDNAVTAVDYMMLKRISLGTHSFPA